MYFSKQINRKIGKAMHDYSMLEDGDKILVAVSGGVDSLVLVNLLSHWRKKAPIDYELTALHVDHGYWRQSNEGVDPVKAIGTQLADIPLVIQESFSGDELPESCYLCAQQRRVQLFDYARDHGCNKIAFGHHKDDLIETLFINMIYGGNISTMLPKQQLFDGRLFLLRPLAYLEKDDIFEIASANGLKEVKNYCPLSDKTRRDYVRRLLQEIYSREPSAKESIFAAMGNVRDGYML